MKQKRIQRYYDRSGKLRLRPYTNRDLCTLYGRSEPSVRKMLKELGSRLGKKDGYYYNIRQVTIIFQEWGMPS